MVKKDEDVDIAGNKGQYFVDKKFNLIVLSNMQNEAFDDSIVQQVLD